MPSTYSSLKFELIATGEQAGTWGNTTNINIGTAIEEAITGSATVTFTSGANAAIALTNTNAAQTARNLRLDLSGTMTTSQYLYVPAIEKFYIINNTLSNTVIVSNGSNAAATGTAVSVPRSTSVMLFNDGVNVTSAISHIPSLANVTISSGNVTVTNLTATTANLTNANVTTANIGTSIITTSETLSYGTANQVQYLNASKVITGSANLTFDGTTLTAAGFADSSLTSGRVTYATTSGNLTDSANLLYSGTDLTVYGLTVGRGAGAVSTNTAVGASALAANTSGSNNTAVGYQAGFSNTTGAYNTFVGGTDDTATASGYSNTTGVRNTAMGAGALGASTTANDNSAFGQQALRSNTTGATNSAFGQGALYLNTTGSSNTAIGRHALLSNTTASNNTAVGYQAGYSNTTGQDNVFIGRMAGYTSNSTGPTGNNVGNVCIGPFAGYGLTTGYANTFVGGYKAGTAAAAGYYVTTGNSNTILGGYNGNQGGLDIRTASNYIVLSDGDGNPRAYWDGTYTYLPSVYSVTTAASANVVSINDGTLRRSTSALKYKQDIRDLEEIDITKFRPVRYKSKCEGDDQTKDHFGVIADEVDAAGIKELVNYNADGEVEGFQYERLTVVLLKKLQVLEAEVKALKGQS